MRIRTATMEDLDRLLEIYNYEVIHGVSTLDIQPKTREEWKSWFLAHNIGNHHLFVAEWEGQAAGYASLSSYREKEAFRSTVELSIYVHPGLRGQGIAGALMSHILQVARADDSIHLVVSVITSGNLASERLHQKFGFTFCGTIPQVGMKFGAYRSIDNYSLVVSCEEGPCLSNSIIRS